MLTHNAHTIALNMQAHGTAMENALVAEMTKQAQLATRRMRELAPKFQSTLTNSIQMTRPMPMVWEVRPGVAYALYREKGTRPGKHLPRFFDPAAKPIVDWLAKTAFAKAPRVRKGTARFAAREMELRDRYMGLSWHAKRKGFKATPFVEPVAQDLANTLPAHMAAVARRLLAQNTGTA